MGTFRSFYLLALLLAAVLAQDEWEDVEWQAEEDYDEEFDEVYAKEVFCTDLKDYFIKCLKVLGVDQKMIAHCNAEVGLKAKSYDDAVEEACQPDTPFDVGGKYVRCKNKFNRENHPEALAATTKFVPIDLQGVMSSCLPFKSIMEDEGWWKYIADTTQ